MHEQKLAVTKTVGYTLWNMTAQEIIEILNQDGSYLIQVSNEHYSITITESNRIRDLNGQLVGIHFSDPTIDTTLKIKDISEVESPQT